MRMRSAEPDTQAKMPVKSVEKTHRASGTARWLRRARGRARERLRYHLTTPPVGTRPSQSIDDGCARLELTVFDGEATLLQQGRRKNDGRARPLAPHGKRAEKRRSDLVTIRPSEQGAAEVDLAYWSNGDQFGEGWRAADSSPGRIIEYAEPELKCWMPMPSANLNRTSMPSPWEGDDDQELDGSGI